jgi:hypothetical protein
MLGFAGLESDDSFAGLLFFPFLGEFGFSFSAPCALPSSGEDDIGGAGGDGGGVGAERGWGAGATGLLGDVTGVGGAPSAGTGSGLTGGGEVAGTGEGTFNFGCTVPEGPGTVGTFSLRLGPGCCGGGGGGGAAMYSSYQEYF